MKGENLAAAYNQSIWEKTDKILKKVKFDSRILYSLKLYFLRRQVLK